MPVVDTDCNEMELHGINTAGVPCPPWCRVETTMMRRYRYQFLLSLEKERAVNLQLTSRASKGSAMAAMAKETTPCCEHRMCVQVGESYAQDVRIILQSTILQSLQYRRRHEVEVLWRVLSQI